jgi:hypothetical protein
MWTMISEFYWREIEGIHVSEELTAFLIREMSDGLNPFH